MATTLTEKLKLLSSELNQINRELQADSTPDLATLSDVRQALENLRLTVWSASELNHARNAAKDPDGILTFLLSERVRAFVQMVNNLCADFDRRVLPREEYVLRPLQRAIHELQRRIK